MVTAVWDRAAGAAKVQETVAVESSVGMRGAVAKVVGVTVREVSGMAAAEAVMAVDPERAEEAAEVREEYWEAREVNPETVAQVVGWEVWKKEKDPQALWNPRTRIRVK